MDGVVIGEIAGAGVGGTSDRCGGAGPSGVPCNWCPRLMLSLPVRMHFP